jgi:hypothetical protein
VFELLTLVLQVYDISSIQKHNGGDSNATWNTL